MKKLALSMGMLPLMLSALGYTPLFENENVRASRVTLEPNEEVAPHNDPYPRWIIPVHGESITRLESDGSQTVIDLRSKEAVFLEADPVGDLHGGLNGATPLEIILIELKQ